MWWVFELGLKKNVATFILLRGRCPYPKADPCRVVVKTEKTIDLEESF